MKKKMVSTTLAESPLSHAEKRRLVKMANVPDEQIDLTEMPELTDTFFKNAIKNPYYRPVKQQVTVRLDADVVAWLKKQGRGYQTRLNQVLRSVMVADLRKPADPRSQSR